MECEHLDKVCGKGLSIELARGAELLCSECHASDSIWLCVTCGVLSCGRYVNAHGLKHKEKTKTHSVCIETKELSVFCYQCDEFILNDTSDGHIEKLRSEILKRTLNESDSPSCGRSLRPRMKRVVPQTIVGGSDTKKTKSPNVKKSRKSKSPRKVLGLKNLGNTCFMNSVLQSLGNIEEFCNILTALPSLEHQLNTNKEAKTAISRLSADGIIVTEELRKVLRALKDGVEKSAISPQSLFHAIWKVVPRFRGYQQQDAHEFLRYMLDRLHTELLLLLPSRFRTARIEEVLRGAPLAKSESVVTSVFGGMLQSEVTCLNCATTSKKLDPFLDLSVDIPQEFTGPVRKTKDGEPAAGCHIYDCLKKFVETEELADTERFFCTVCKSKQPSTKKFLIRCLPNVLCLHVKRFRWTAYARTKLDNHIEFPLNGLDMSGYLLKNLSGTRYSNGGNNSLYDLAAVIVHHGSGAGSGHYTAFATNNKAWFHFNDCTVRESDYQTVYSSKAYILFYVQRELDLTKV